MGHMVADSWEELHLFAKKLGLKREWFQEKAYLSHYDLTTESMKNKAEKLGALKVNPRKIIEALDNLARMENIITSK